MLFCWLGGGDDGVVGGNFPLFLQLKLALTATSRHRCRHQGQFGGVRVLVVISRSRSLAGARPEELTAASEDDDIEPARLGGRLLAAARLLLTLWYLLLRLLHGAE